MYVGCTLNRLFEILDRYHRPLVGESLVSEEGPDNNMRSYILKEIMMCLNGISVSVKGRGKLSDKVRNETADSAAELAQLISDDMAKKVTLHASEHHISRVIYMNSNVSDLNQSSMNVIEEVACSRTEGILQASLGKNLGIDPKSIFYHLKAPIESGLVQSTAVAAKTFYTNLLIHQRFLRVKGDDDDDDEYVVDVSENSKVTCDFHLARRTLCQLLQEAQNNTLILQDVRLLMKEAGFDVPSYYLKNMVIRLVDDGCLERLNVRFEDTFYLCIKLIKHYDTFLAECAAQSNESGEGDGHDVCAFGLRYDMSLVQQIYIIVAAYGQKGATSSDIRKHLNNFRPKEIGIILTLLESNKCQNKVRKVSVNVGKVHGFRFYVTNPPKCLVKDIENFRAMTGLTADEEHDQNLIATPAEEGTSVFRVSSAFHQRKQNMMQLIYEYRIVDFNVDFIEAYIRRFPSTTGHLIDRKTLYRAALDLQKEKQIRVHKIEIPKFGKVISKSFFSLIEIDVGHPELNQLIQDIQVKLLQPKVAPSNWRDLPVQDVAVERPQIALELAAPTKRKSRMRPKVKTRSINDGEISSIRSDHDEERSESELTSTDEDADTGAESWNHRRLRNRKSKPGYVEDESAITPYVLGLIRPKMQRVKYFHMFLFEYLKHSQTKVFQSARLFREIPLDIYLKTLGHYKVKESAELTNYLDTGGNTSLPISQLPYPVMKEVYAGGISRFRQHLVSIVKVLLQLALLKSRGEHVIQDNPGLEFEYELLSEVGLENFKTGQLVRMCVLSDAVEINNYWNELESLCVSWKGDAENHAPANVAFMFYAHNWGHVQLVTYEQRLQLNRYIQKNEDDTISTPLDDIDQCAHIAEELGIEPRNVIAYFRRYLAKEGCPWRAPGTVSKMNQKTENRTIADFFSKSHKKRHPVAKKTVNRDEISLLLTAPAPVEEKVQEVRSLTDDEVQYAFLAFCILKMHKEKYKVAISWLAINQNVLAIKFPHNAVIPEPHLRRYIMNLAKSRKYAMWYGSIRENWNKFREEAVETQTLPFKVESFLQEVEYLKSLDLASTATTAVPKPDADVALPSCKEILENYSVSHQSYLTTHDISQKFYESFKSMHLRASLLNEDYSAFVKTETECRNFMDQRDVQTSEVEALLKQFVSMSENDYDSTSAFALVDKYPDDMVSEAIKKLRQENVLIDARGGGICRPLPGRMIQLSKIASDNLIEHYNDGMMERASEAAKKLLVSQQLKFEADCDDHFMFAALQLFSDDLIQVDVDYKCPEGYMMRRKEIEIRGTAGLESKVVLSARELAENIASKRSAEYSLDPKDEKIVGKLMDRLGSGESFSTDQLLEEIRCNPPAVLSALLESHQITRSGINQPQWSKPQNPEQPKVWHKLDGTINLPVYNGYVETVESFIISFPGVTVDQIYHRFGIILSPVEVAELLEHLENENRIERLFVASRQHNLWNVFDRRKYKVTFIPTRYKVRKSPKRDSIPPLL